MKSKAAAAEDALRSLDSAITSALKSGVDEEEVYRAINAAYKKKTGRFLDIPRDSKRKYFSNRVYRLALLFCAVVISVIHTATFRGQKLPQPIKFESNYIPQNQRNERSMGSDFTVQKVMENTNGLRKQSQTREEEEEEEEEERLSGSSLGVQTSMKYTKVLQNQTVLIGTKSMKGLSGGGFGVPKRTNKTYTKKSYLKNGKEENSPSGFNIKMRSVYPMRDQNQIEKEKETVESFSGRNSTIQTWIAQHNLEAISQLLQYAPANISMNKNKTEYPCPLDVFFHDECLKQSGGTVCVFPGAILKRVEDSKVGPELGSFMVLNDTRIFPELYYQDYKCKTVLQENVRPPGLKSNIWCANATYYSKFYKSAFEIYAANNIIPLDLNTCCNTLVKNDYIRIIDFGLYLINQPPDKVLSENKIMLEKILDTIPDEIANSKRKGRCE